MQGCIVPPKSNKLIACVQDVAKTCVLDSLKTVKLFLSFQRILSIWNRFQPVLQGKPLEQVRIPCRLARRAICSTVLLFRKLLLCVHVQNRHTLDPPVRRGIMLERRSVLIAFALPSVRGTTACHLAICRGTFPHLPTVRCSGLNFPFGLVRSRAYTLPPD